MLVVCSICKKVKIASKWREVDQGTFDRLCEFNFPVSHGYCDECAESEMVKLKKQRKKTIS